VSVNLLVKNAGDNCNAPAFDMKQRFWKKRSHGWDFRAAPLFRKTRSPKPYQ
jgi:hypothetical protein